MKPKDINQHRILMTITITMFVTIWPGQIAELPAKELYSFMTMRLCRKREREDAMQPPCSFQSCKLTHSRIKC